MSDEQKSPETSPCGCNSPKDTGLSNTWKTVILGLVILAAGAVASHRILINPSPKSCGGGCCPGQMTPSAYQGCCPGEAATQTPEYCPADTVSPEAKAMAMPSDAPGPGRVIGCCPMGGTPACETCPRLEAQENAGCGGCAGQTAQTP